MSITLKRASGNRDYLELSRMAHTIWREYYTGILSVDQIEYMLERFQSAEAIQDAVAQGYEYYFIQKTPIRIGYAALKPWDPPSEPKMFISKFYLDAAHRHRGYGKDAMNEIVRLAESMRLSAVWLTVAKVNLESEEIYERFGFKNVQSVVNDIGGGYVMDDYVMEKALGAGAYVR